MGRGDNRTKKGKRFTGSFGKIRPAKTNKANAANTAVAGAKA
jgi:30S ribosomal protein S31